MMPAAKSASILRSQASWLITLTETGELSAPFAPTARATMLCGPSATAVVFQDAVYGAVVSEATTAPSTRKSTRDAVKPGSTVAASACVPKASAPVAGVSIRAAGGGG